MRIAALLLQALCVTACFLLAEAKEPVLRGGRALADVGPKLQFPLPDSACDPKSCVCTPQQLVKAFRNTTRKGSLKRSICVAESLMARVIYPGKGVEAAPSNQTYLANPLRGRWMTFAIDSKALAHVLTLGQYRARSILSNLGFGPPGVFEITACGYPLGNNSFRPWLAVWDGTLSQAEKGDKCATTNATGAGPGPCNPSYLSGYWDSLPDLLMAIYGDDLPKDSSWLDKPLAFLRDHTFESSTGCSVDAVTALAAQYRDKNAEALVAAAGCDKVFAEAVQFHDKNCSFNKAFESYRDAKEQLGADYGKSCASDEELLQKYPTAAQGTDDEVKTLAMKLRAFLFSRWSFSQYYTGYGYTANDYIDNGVGGLFAEYWMGNANLGRLDPDWAATPVDCYKA